jgi:Family of unknown function (DUF6210)
MKRISLSELDQIGVIIGCSSGVIYENNVGGISGMVEALEGVFVPLSFTEADAGSIVNNEYVDWEGGISATIADKIDDTLRKRLPFAFLSIDRDRLADSCRAWIYLLVADLGSDAPYVSGIDRAYEYRGPIGGFGSCRGVLTW